MDLGHAQERLATSTVDRSERPTEYVLVDVVEGLIGEVATLKAEVVALRLTVTTMQERIAFAGDSQA